MCARSPEKGKAGIGEIKKMHPSANIDLLQMDLMDLTTVVSAAKHFLSLEGVLHGLVNNAGIMATPFQMTKDGYESQWQTNYVSHWVFTEHLLPLLQRTANSLPAGSVRIVNMSSSGHLGAPKGGINFEDTSIKDGGTWARYGQSKLANILHTNVLHEKYGPGSGSPGEIWVTSVHPGIVGTNLDASVKQSGMGMSTVFWLVRQTGLMWFADRGAWNSLFCAASQDMTAQQSGMYLEIYGRFGEPKRLSAAAKDHALAKRLEDCTREVMAKEGWI